MQIRHERRNAMQLHILQRFQMIIAGIVCLLALVLVTACAGVSSSGGNSRTITGTLISVDAAQHSAIFNVDGQEVTVAGLTDQQVTTLRPKVGKTFTLEVTGSGNTVTISANSNLQLDETAT